MAHLIDKDAVLAIIEQLKDEAIDMEDKSRWFLVAALTRRIEALEVKEGNLDNFIKEEFNKYSCVDGYGQLSISYNMAEFYGMIKRLTKAQKGEEHEV